LQKPIGDDILNQMKQFATPNIVEMVRYV